MNDLVKAAIEPGQSLGDTIRWCCSWRGRGRNGPRLRVGVRHALELARQRVETLVDRSEVFAEVIVAVRIPV